MMRMKTKNMNETKRPVWRGTICCFAAIFSFMLAGCTNVAPNGFSNTTIETPPSEAPSETTLSDLESPSEIEMIQTEGASAQNLSSRQNIPSATITAQPTTISLDQAKNAALLHAGMDENTVIFTQAELDYHDGIAEYEIEFMSSTIKYDYDINATDGTIRKFSQEQILPVQTLPSTSSITIEQAQSIALQHAGIGTENTLFSKTEIDSDYGKVEYEFVFTNGSIKYEYEISAVDGTILKYSQEFSTSVSQSLPTAPSIQEPLTIEQAKLVALYHAQVDATSAIFTKEDTDYDNGQLEYEFTFIVGTVKYEYDISVSGVILKSSQEPVVQNTLPSATTPTSVITLEDAKTIALTYAKLSADAAIFTKAELDYDDGRTEYEIEFYADGREYEFTIDAASGTVLEMDID